MCDNAKGSASYAYGPRPGTRVTGRTSGQIPQALAEHAASIGQIVADHRQAEQQYRVYDE